MNGYLQLDCWTFLAQTVDVNAGVQYGFVGSLVFASYDVSWQIYDERVPTSGSFYQLTSAATFQWTNDQFLSSCSCTMQYVRVYTDYAPSQLDQFYNLELMNPNSNDITLITEYLIKILYLYFRQPLHLSFPS